MIKKKNLCIVISLIAFIAMIVMSSTSVAMSDPISNPNAYKPGPIEDADVITSKAGVIFDTITTVGIIVAIVTIIIIGIKYMVGSVEEKAEYKKTMVPYVIGVIMLAGISGILKLIANIVEGLG